MKKLAKFSILGITLASFLGANIAYSGHGANHPSAESVKKHKSLSKSLGKSSQAPADKSVHPDG